MQVVDIKKTSATIQWTDGAPNGQPIYVYIVSGRTIFNDTWLNITRGLYFKPKKFNTVFWSSAFK